jgi:hypothetical protein
MPGATAQAARIADPTSMSNAVLRFELSPLVFVDMICANGATSR